VWAANTDTDIQTDSQTKARRQTGSTSIHRFRRKGGGCARDRVVVDFIVVEPARFVLSGAGNWSSSLAYHHHHGTERKAKTPFSFRLYCSSPRIVPVQVEKKKSKTQKV
jgi:hypothetical protein